MSANMLEHRGVVHGVILTGTPQALAASGAVAVDLYKTNVDTTSGALAITLPNGYYDGQLKLIQMVVDGGAGANDAVLTPQSLWGGTTITFADVGDCALLAWNNGAWFVVDLFNRVDGATAPVVA